jgi:hypothetical protein
MRLGSFSSIRIFLIYLLEEGVMIKNQKFSVKVWRHNMKAQETERPKGVAASKVGNKGTRRSFGSGCRRTSPWRVHGIANAAFFLFFMPVLLFAAPSLAYDDCDFEIAIQISPNIINLESRSRVLTVHTDIAFGDVDPDSVSLILPGDQYVDISSWKADDLGYFVAKFLMVDIEDMKLELEIGAFNTFAIMGKTTEKEEFCGEQDIMIDEIVPEGNKEQKEEREKIRKRLEKCE